jgi:GTP cyclohydrolase II
MLVAVSEPIDLKTVFGSFRVYHLHTRDTVDQQPLEGVAISSLKEGSISPILVRVQSSCLFSESLSSVDCDCALQLDYALEAISKDEGLVIYYYEEGRGMGLEFKVRAIRLQQIRNLDTGAAYRALGANGDARNYIAAAKAIQILASGRDVVLLSNSLEKESLLRHHGIKVIERRQILCGTTNPEIVSYLISKKRIFGHDIPDLPEG